MRGGAGTRRALARLKAKFRPVAVAIISGPLDPSPDPRSADCWQAVVTDGSDETDFVICEGYPTRKSGAALTKATEETILSEFPEGQWIEGVRQREMLVVRPDASARD
jgi:hypothetical protein